MLTVVQSRLVIHSVRASTIFHSFSPSSERFISQTLFHYLSHSFLMLCKTTNTHGPINVCKLRTIQQHRAEPVLPAIWRMSSGKTKRISIDFPNRWDNLCLTINTIGWSRSITPHHMCVCTAVRRGDSEYTALIQCSWLVPCTLYVHKQLFTYKCLFVRADVFH